MKDRARVGSYSNTSSCLGENDMRVINETSRAKIRGQPTVVEQVHDEKIAMRSGCALKHKDERGIH